KLNFFCQAEDGIRDRNVTGVQTCALPIFFAIPGMGRLLYDAVTNGDTPVMQAAIVCIVALTVIITTLTDVLYALINPTVRSANEIGRASCRARVLKSVERISVTQNRGTKK